MSFYKILCCLTVMTSSFFASGCSDDDNDTDIIDLGAKTTLALGRYYGPTGSTVSPAWQPGDRGVLMVAGAGTAEKQYATPITTGSPSALFMFQVKAARNAASTVVSVWPETADVTVTDGVIRYTVPTSQNGTIDPLLLGYTSCKVAAYEGVNISLTQPTATLYVNIARGNYSVASVEVSASTGIAGNVGLDTATGETSADATSVTVTPAQPVSCVNESQTLAVTVAPATLESGYNVKITTTDGNVIEESYADATVWEAASSYQTATVTDPHQKTIVFCGSNMVYMVEPSLTTGGRYENGVTWRWDATSISSTLGLAANRLNHLDDCKPVDNGKKLLVTSSYSWVALLDIATKDLLFWTTKATGAHSAEMLPGNKIAVANSTSGNSIQLYDISRPNEILFEIQLDLAHGVVWMESTQRLYAIGNQTLNVYKLEGADTFSPKLVLERSVKTPQGSTHDLFPVDSYTLTVAGVRCYLYDINADTFKEMSLFRNSTQLKSVNYNPETGECWYTDSTTPEGTQTWSTQTLHYTTNVNGLTDDMTIKVPDLDVYKVRVLNW